MIPIRDLFESHLTVTDLQFSMAFFGKVLGLELAGRPMKGFVFVSPAGYRSDRDLKSWTRRGLDFVLGQPPK